MCSSRNGEYACGIIGVIHRVLILKAVAIAKVPADTGIANAGISSFKSNSGTAAEHAIGNSQAYGAE